MRRGWGVAAIIAAGSMLGGCISAAPVGTVQMAAAGGRPAQAGSVPREACAETREQGRRLVTCAYPEFTFSAAGNGARDAFLTGVTAEYAIYDGDGRAEVTIRGGGTGVTHALSALTFDVTATDAGGGRRQILHIDPTGPVTINCDAVGRSQGFEVKGFASAALVISLKPLPLSISSPMLRCSGG